MDYWAKSRGKTRTATFDAIQTWCGVWVSCTKLFVKGMTEMAVTKFRASVAWSGEHVRSVARIRGKEVVIDEPALLGGTDLGPNPVELILAALGGCLNVLISSWAAQHSVDLRGVTTEVEGRLDVDGFMGKNPDVRPGFLDIHYRVVVGSPSSPEQVQELLEHAQRMCPVKDTLTGVPVLVKESPGTAKDHEQFPHERGIGVSVPE